MSVALRRLGATLALVFATHGAAAALFDDEEARKRIAETNQRLAQVQRQLEDRIAAIEAQLKSGGLIDLARDVDLMKAEVAKLRGQIEVLNHEFAELQKRQRDLYVDLDTRLRRLEAAPVPQAAAPAPEPPPAAVPPALPGGVAGALPPAAAAGASAPRPADPATEQRAYDAALELFKRGDYAGAIAAFGNFVRTYPRSPLAASAQYWVGNAHFARRDYRAAITAQRTLVANYPDSSKVPDALLNVASAQGELGDAAGAKKSLEDLVARFPQSDAAAKAKQRLAGR